MRKPARAAAEIANARHARQGEERESAIDLSHPLELRGIEAELAPPETGIEGLLLCEGFHGSGTYLRAPRTEKHPTVYLPKA